MKELIEKLDKIIDLLEKKCNFDEEDNESGKSFTINSESDLERALRESGWNKAPLYIFMLSEESDRVGHQITDEVQTRWSYKAPEPYRDEKRGRFNISSTKQVSLLKSGELMITNQHFDPMGGWAENKVVTLPKSISISNKTCRLLGSKDLYSDSQDEYSEDINNILLKNSTADKETRHWPGHSKH